MVVGIYSVIASGFMALLANGLRMASHALVLGIAAAYVERRPGRKPRRQSSRLVDRSQHLMWR
jgi:Co/Zn/Cd efflux system component